MTTSEVDKGLWLRGFGQARPGAPRLVCFPHAGGAASWYRPMAVALGSDAGVLAVQYPGRQDRRAEPPVDDVVELARRVAPVFADGDRRPLVFFGHSMGAVVAFEVARELAARGLPGPAHLFASGRRAPTRYRDERVHERDDDGVIAEVEALGGTDARVLRDPELRQMVLPALRADYRAVETYRCPPGPPLTCPVTALTGDADPQTTLDEAAAWREATDGEFALEVFPGGHFFLAERQPEVVRAVARTLTALA